MPHPAPTPDTGTTTPHQQQDHPSTQQSEQPTPTTRATRLHPGPVPEQLTQLTQHPACQHCGSRDHIHAEKHMITSDDEQEHHSFWTTVCGDCEQAQDAEELASHNKNYVEPLRNALTASIGKDTETFAELL